MAKFELRPPRRHIKQSTAISTQAHPYQNLLADLEINQPHQVWCSDLSALKYQGGLWYLAMIEDVATRQIIAAKVGKHHASQLVLNTLAQAFAIGARPTIFHLDQGTEFRVRRCTDFLQSDAVQISVSAVASLWQNGYSESFFGRFKHEFGGLNRFPTIGHLMEAIYQHIHYYNNARIHTALKMPPTVYAFQAFSGSCLHKLGT